MADTFGLISEYVKQIGASRHNKTNPVDPKGNPISDILKHSNRYGPAIPTMALQQFSPDTQNAKTLQGGRGNIQYSAKTYTDIPQDTIQLVRLLTDEVVHINHLVNRMIRLRGEKAYEIVSGQDDGLEKQNAIVNDLRENGMIRRDYASTVNAWVMFLLAGVFSLWIFTIVYLVVSGGVGSAVQTMVKYASFGILPLGIGILMLYGYMMIPGYGLMLPSPGPSANQFS
jgi:hypothetical protein